jgi:4-amino-4-deoxy-L-arabinose transferase-like glycosyltransferase
MYVAVGLGVLTKGPIAALLPGLVFALYLAAHRELRRVRDMMIPAGIAIVLAVVVPWYVAQYQRHGWTYIASFFLGENLARYTEGLGVNATRPFWFYVPVVFSDGFPLSILIVAAAVCWFRDRRGSARHDVSHRIRTVLWIWIVVIVAFFSASTAKQDLYIYPIVPAIAALAGVTIARVMHGDRSSPRRVVAISLAVGGFATLVLGAGVLYLLNGAGAVYALRGILSIGVLAIAGGVATLILAVRHAFHGAVAALCATLAAVNWVFVTRTLPSFEVYKPVPGFVRVLTERATSEDVVATFNVALPSLVFYLQRHVDMSYEAAPIQVFLDGQRAAFVVMSRDDYAGIDAAIDRPTCIISVQPTFNVKLRDILAREPPPDLVLVTNRCAP